MIRNVVFKNGKWELRGLWKELVKDRKANYKFLKCFKAKKSERVDVWAGMPATKGAARRHCWEAKLDIISDCSTGDVWKAPLLDLFIPGSITEELEPGVLWWAAALRSNESLGLAGSHPKMWKELGNEDREQGKKRHSLKSSLTWGQQRVAKGWADFERRKYLKLQSRGSGTKETHWTRTKKQSLRTLRVLRKWGKYTICLHFVTANSTEVITRYR